MSWRPHVHGWWEYQHHGFMGQFNWFFLRFENGPFSPLEVCPAVVDDFGNLVQVEA